MVSDGSIELEVEHSDTVSLKNYKKTEAVRYLYKVCSSTLVTEDVSYFVSVVCLRTFGHTFSTIKPSISKARTCC